MKKNIRLLTIPLFVLVLTSCGSLNFFQSNQAKQTSTNAPAVVPLSPTPADSTDTSGSLPESTTPQPTSNVIPVMSPTQKPVATPEVKSNDLTAIPPKKKKIVPLNAGSTSEPVSDKPNTE